ncbi:alpha-tubulin N-acetyltransferase 1-like, partial [Brachionus plicatilis]
MKQKVAHVIDRMGEASSRAQGLREVITSCRKLNLNDQHRIYLMKDPVANNGKGSVVGFLKVGEKNLFLHDHQGQTHEIMSLCVLDFYVYDNQQRRGYGLKLFNKMLEMERVLVQHLAVDSPSDKSMRFLKKHYDL